MIGLRRTRIDFAVLSKVLKGNGRRHQSDLPLDATIRHVVESSRSRDAVEIVFASESWAGPREGEEIPPIVITVTEWP